MEKKQKIIQVYAVIICVIAVITVLISLSSLVSAIIDRDDPLHAQMYEVNLTSFENFKMDALKSTKKDQAYIPDDKTLRNMYEDAKADKINLVKHHTYRTIIVSSLIISISIILFATHWWIIRKIGKEKIKVSP
jgi:hypothetical protein